MSIRQRDDGKNRFYKLFECEPIRVRWGSWVSDTRQLDRDGWKFSADEKFDEYQRVHRVYLAVTSPDNEITIAGNFYVDLQRLNYAIETGWGAHVFNGCIDMKQYNCKDVFRTIGMDELNQWQGLRAIDIREPTVLMQRDFRLRDFKFFKQLEGHQETQNEIYIPNESVDDLFNKILQIQYPQQQEIKKGLIMPESKPIIQAKIYSLVA